MVFVLKRNSWLALISFLITVTKYWGENQRKDKRVSLSLWFENGRVHHDKEGMVARV